MVRNSFRSLILLGVLGLAALAAGTDSKTVLVTGATGKTGQLVYKQLKAAGNFEVRGLIRNVSKAQKLLECGNCTEQDGIFVGDVTKKETLTAAMTNVDVLVITTAAAFRFHLTPPFVDFPPGGTPKDIDWIGGRNQVSAFMSAEGPTPPTQRHVVLVSVDGTTVPDSALDTVGHGEMSFYKLNLEAYVMSTGARFTIAKPCGLSDGHDFPRHLYDSEILVALDDAPYSKKKAMIARKNVAKVLVAAIENPDLGSNIRFDICASIFGSQQEDMNDVLKAAHYSWDVNKKLAEESSVAALMV